MPYKAEISRSNPSCFIFLIDQSESMTEVLPDQGKSKAEALADATNRLLQTLVLRCVRGETVLDRFHVGVIGYGSKVASALGGPLEGRKLAPLSELAQNPLRVEQRTRKAPDGAGGLIEQSFRFPIWFDAVADGMTPMCGAIDLAWSYVVEFLQWYPHCYPPLIINLTDGRPSDGNPEPHAATVRSLGSSDGNVLLFNCHLSIHAKQAIEFPDREADLPDNFAKMLFKMSSPLPLPMRETAKRDGFKVGEGSRGFMYNADMVSVIRFLDVGTRVDPKNLR
ncbi:MAG: VWA domain-containing protein [Planctomycetia bacterium]|nr:VWA domain-containing protein [Planctomycetia bacterium]